MSESTQYVPYKRNNSMNSSFVANVSYSPKDLINSNRPHYNSSPYSRGSPKFKNEFNQGKKPWKPQAKSYFKQSMLTDPWSNCKKAELINYSKQTANKKAKRCLNVIKGRGGRYFSS